MSSFKSFAFGFASLLLTVSCNQQPQQPDQIQSPSNNAEVSIISGVSSKGPISSALIEIIAFNANNGLESGAPIASTTTNANGQWSVSIPAASHTVALLIKSSGGEYLDESDPEPDPAKKRKISFAPTDSIHGVLFPGFNTASVTMMSAALVEKSRVEANGSNFLNVLNNNRNIAASALGFDPFTVAAANPLAPALSASVDSIEYAMYLGGMATALNSAAILLGLPVPDFAVVDAFIRDMADGRLNGINQAGAVSVLVNAVATPFPTSINLNQSIKRFRNNNFAAYAVTPVTTIVTVNESVMATTGVNSSPNAVDDVVVTVENAAVVTQNVLLNDVDPDGNTLTLSGFTQPANGQATNNNNGTFTYTPNTGFSGPNVFTYTVDDGRGGTDVAQVIITVTPTGGGGGGGPNTNISPTADAGADQAVDELSPVNLSGTGADSDGTVAGYQWSQVSGPVVTLTNASTAAASFVSPEVLIGNVGVLVFQLAVSDNNAGVGLDFVTVIVNPVAIAPTANAGADQTLNEMLAVSLNGSASSDDRSIVAYAWTQTAGTPTVSLNNANTASPDFAGPDISNDSTFTFELTVTDDEGGSATDTVDINLVSLNAGPTVVDDPGESTAEDTSVLMTTLLGNDSDGEGDAFTIDSVTQPASGSVVIETGNTSVTYTPAADFNGVDTFTYNAIDEFGALSIASATVTVTVAAVNDDPVANTDTPVTQQGFPVTIIDLLANDTDLENDSLSITGVTQPADGIALNNGDGTVTYTPNLAFNGVDSFTYSIVDGNGGSANGTINVTVIADSDGDGVIDSQEVIDGTNPLLADSDGDGFFDGHEKVVGTDANLITEIPPTTVISAGNTNNIISVDTTWNLNNSPYWLQSDVTIQGGATLTVEAGVVVKSSLNIDIFVNSGGILNASGNAPEPQHVIFTGSLDDTINGDTNGDGVATTPSDADWAGIDFQAGSTGTLSHAISRYAVYCISIFNSSPIISNVDVGDCSAYGFDVQTSSGTHTTNLNDINLIDYDLNGESTGFSGIRIFASGSATNITNLSNLNIDEAGSATNYGLYIYASGGDISGSLDNLVVTNSSNDGLTIFNNGTGDIDLAINTVSISNPGGSGIDINNTSSGTINTSFDGINSISATPAANIAFTITNSDPIFLASGSWNITNAGYGLGLTNSDGSFNNFTLDNMAIAGIRLGAASDPLQFSNIVLTNAITPYELVGQNLTATIIAGYDFSDASVSKSYIRITGTLLADTTLGVDPLATGTSVWRVPGNIVVPAGITMTVTDDAVLKFDLNTILYVDGTLSVTNGGGGAAIFTSIRDDSVGDDLGDATAAARGDWGYINPRTNGSIAMDSAIVRYMDYGIYHANTNPGSFSVSNSTFTEFYNYGLYLYPNTTASYTLTNNIISNGSFNDGLYVYETTGDAVSLDIDGLTIDSVGNGTTDRGMFLDINNGATLTGTINNVTISNITGAGIYLDATTAGVVDPVFSNITINPTVGTHGMQLIGDNTTAPTLNNININAGQYNLTVQGVAGSYSNMNLDGATFASIYFSNTPNPALWDDASIMLSNSPTPYQLLTDLPTSVGILGTADLGYTADTGLNQLFVRLNGTISDTTAVADPLNTGTSVYYVAANTTIPVGATLTVLPNAILKFELGAILFVDGNLTINGTAANEAYFTSIRDDNVGGDSNGDGSTTVEAASDWGYIQFRAGSNIAVDFGIFQYMDYGFYSTNALPGSFTVSNSTLDNFQEYGFYLSPSAGLITYDISNTAITNGSRQDAIYLLANTGDQVTVNFSGLTITNIGDQNTDHGIEFDISVDATLTGSVTNTTISDINVGGGIFLNDSSTGLVDPLFSGLTINMVGRNGLQLIGDATTTPTVDNSVTVNNISDGIHNLTIQGVGGSYANMNLDSASSASIYQSLQPNPSFWDDATIVLSNAPSPYRLLSAMPVSIGVLGTADLGYTAATGLVENYIEVAGTLASDITLIEDPLNTISPVSVWRAPANITVAAGAILTLTDNAILKFDNSLQIYVNGSLAVTSSAGNEAIFTSIIDDVGNDTNLDAALTMPAPGNWYAIQVEAGANINIDNAIIRYVSYALYMPGRLPNSYSVTNTTIDSFQQYGIYLHSTAGAVTYTLDTVSISNGGVNDGIYIFADSGDDITLAFTDITITTVGNGGGDYAIEMDINNDATLTGLIDGATISDIANSGIHLDNSGTGTVDPVFTNLNIFDVGAITAGHGVNFIGTANGSTTPTIDNSGGVNTIGAVGPGSGGVYGLVLQGVEGSYSFITIRNSTSSSLYFSLGAAPTVFANITLEDSPSPYTLIGQNLPVNVSYIAGTGLVEDYAIFRGLMIEHVTLGANPLGGSSFWHVSVSDLDVTAGTTLTLGQNALVKVANGYIIDVLSGGTLNVTATAGNEAIITSFTDDNVGNPTASSAAIGDWEGLYFRQGSLGGTIDYLTTYFGLDGINISNTGTGLTFNNLSVNYSQEGVRINATTTADPVFNNLEIYECSSTHLYLEGAGTMAATFTGNLIITDIDGGNGTRGIYTTSADTTTISGFTITGSNTGIEIAGGSGANRIENNIVRQAATRGISMTADGNPWVRNNIIVNNGLSSTGSGIYMNNGNGIIFGNLIRDNTGYSGAGISVNNSSPVIENNLIVENHSTSTTSNSGGSGIFISGNSSPVINNNTIANNTAADALNEGAGITVESTAGAITLIDNIIYGNTDGAAAANDIYDEVDRVTTHNDNLIGVILNSVSNLFTDDGSDIVGSDPLFTDAWYLNVTALQGGSDSPAIDAGSVNADSVVPFDLASLTTRTDGGNDGIADMPAVNIGYHYPGAATAVSAADSIVSPATSSVTGSVAVVVTVTPRSNVPAIVGAGLDVIALATVPARLGKVIDLGDGSYEVTYTTPASNTDSDTVTFTVNGITVTPAAAAISWVP